MTQKADDTTDAIIDPVADMLNQIDTIEQYSQPPEPRVVLGHPLLPTDLRVVTMEHFEGLDLPKYQSSLASGFDISAAIYEPIHLNTIGASAKIPTGLKFAVPPGFELQCRPRSGLAAKHGITVTNTPGTIDADYRGEIFVLLTNLHGRRFTIDRGMRIAQLVLCPVVQGNIVQVDDLDDTERGDGGFGSTGV